MDFEFDEEKSAMNKLKHGVDFNEAQRLWQDVDVIEIPAKSADEPRSLLIGRMGGNLWSAIFTRRKGKIRIISVRRARTNEKALYEQTEEPNDTRES